MRAGCHATARPISLRRRICSEKTVFGVPKLNFDSGKAEPPHQHHLQSAGSAVAQTYGIAVADSQIDVMVSSVS
jgi:hypothetical protein